MSLLEVAASAGIPAAPATRAASAKRALVLRIGVALAWVAAGHLLGEWLYHQPLLALLGTTSVCVVSAAILFGWVGVGAVIVGQLVYSWVGGAFVGAYPWVSTAAYALAATFAFGVFRHVRGLSRQLSDGRTLAWFTAATGLGTLLSTTALALALYRVNVAAQIAVWLRSTLVSVWVFVPPVVLVGRRLLAAAVAPIPGEPLAAPARRIALVRTSLPGETVQVVGVETRAPAGARDLFFGLLAVVAVTAGKVLLSGGWSSGAAWWNFLYLLIVWWQARRLLLPGALFSGAAVAAGSLVAQWAAAPKLAPTSDEALVVYAQILALWSVAVVLGLAREREVRLLDGLAHLNERLAQDLQRVVRALTGAVEAKDAYTGGHLQRVQTFAMEVGRRLGLSARELELLQIASTLHDIGKIGIPETILNKRGPLADEERAVMQQHPEIGARMLARIDGLREAAPLVLHHQERWDGRRDGTFPGYPAGLAGVAIPLGARIIAVVDCFDAMTTDRPYRDALDLDTARGVLTGERGAQFDPRVVDTFLALLDQQPWR